jgi:hypothetical protein
MPLLDHFHPPLAPRRHWESFHTAWAGYIAELLNEQLLPDNYFAEEHSHVGGRVEIDIATLEETSPGSSSKDGTTATLPTQVWTPPAPSLVMPGLFPDSFEVLVFYEEGGARLVAAVELVSPGNKDRQESRRAFATKCANYLYQGIGLVVVDVVTNRQANLHDEIIQVMGNRDEYRLSFATNLYGVAYRPIKRNQEEQIDVWSATLAVGQPLPVLPLSLAADLCLPLDLEATYTDTRQHRRLA